MKALQSFSLSLFFILLAALSFAQPSTPVKKPVSKSGPSRTSKAPVAASYRPVSMIHASVAKTAPTPTTPAPAPAPASVTLANTTTATPTATTAVVSAPPTPTPPTVTSAVSATGGAFTKSLEKLMKRTAITGILFIGKGIGYGLSYTPEKDFDGMAIGRNTYTVLYLSRSNGDGEGKSPTLFLGAARQIKILPFAVGLNTVVAMQPYYVPKVAGNVKGSYSSYFEYDTRYKLKAGIGVHAFIQAAPRIKAIVTANTNTGIGFGVSYSL